MKFLASDQELAELISSIIRNVSARSFAFLDEGLAQLTEETPIIIWITWLRTTYVARFQLKNWNMAAKRFKDYVDSNGLDSRIYRGLI